MNPKISKLEKEKKLRQVRDVSSHRLFNYPRRISSGSIELYASSWNSKSLTSLELIGSLSFPQSLSSVQFLNYIICVKGRSREDITTSLAKTFLFTSNKSRKAPFLNT